MQLVIGGLLCSRMDVQNQPPSDGPTWELQLASPLRNDALHTTNDIGRRLNFSASGGMSPNVQSPLCEQRVQNSQNRSPLVVKRGFGNDNTTPFSVTGSAKRITPLKTGVQDVKKPRRIFVPARFTTGSSIAGLENSVYATIECAGDVYVCMHDIVDFVTKKMATSHCQVKWRHFDGNKFLFTLPSRDIVQRFIEGGPKFRISDALVSFTGWTLATGKTVTHSGSAVVADPARVWLKLTGLPVECLTYEAAEFVVSGFGRLCECNVKRTETYLGGLYVMIEAIDVDAIEPDVSVVLPNCSEVTVTIEKLYACSVASYNVQGFGTANMDYDEIVRVPIQRGKLTAFRPIPKN